MSRHDALRRIRNEQTRSRRLLLERLEDRFCLCTTSHGFYLEGWGPNNEYVTWLKFECTPSDDVILDIDVPGGETTIHWESPFGWIDTGAQYPNLGTNFLEIMIDGLGGRDNVNLSGMGDNAGGWDHLIKSLIFDGGDGNDTFTSPTGPLVPPYPSGPPIVFLGGNGADTFNGGNSAELFHGGADGDTAHGGGGHDILVGDPEGYVGVAMDTLYGEGGNDTITGGYYMDYLYGGDDADVISGGDGDDFIDGGHGQGNRI